MSYNKSDGFKVQVNNANNTTNNNINRQQSSKFQRQTSSTSVIPTFFRWFKKQNHRKQQFYGGRSAIEPSLRRYDSSSRESLSFNSSQSYLDNHLSPSLSCDSVVSTSTTGFAFIKPNKYGNLVEPKILSDNQLSNTNSITCLKSVNGDLFSSSSTSISDSTGTKQVPKLTLKQKYFLFESDTLKSTACGNYDNISDNKQKPYDSSRKFNQENIYVNNKQYNHQEPILPNRRHRSRRTVSDSSKELQSGAYVHVKGKRKAPEPPSSINSVVCSSVHQNSNPFEDLYVEPLRDNYRTLSPISTFGRKKRKAPPPPLLVELQSTRLNFTKQDSSKSTSVSKKITPAKDDSFAEEIIIEPAKINEIKYSESIIGVSNSNVQPANNHINILLNKSQGKIYTDICSAGVNQLNQNQNKISSDSTNKNLDNSIEKMATSPLKQIKQKEIRSPNKTSTKMDDDLQNLNLTNISSDANIHDSRSLTPPHSPISPRPWYKRPISTNKESVIPFKREVVLKTMEKRRTKQKEFPDSGLPEVSFSRSSIFDSTSKFNLFTRQRDTKISKDNKDKRLSNINMPNISELDREAAEILMSESKQTNWNENKSYNPPEHHLTLHQEMFGAINVTNNQETLAVSKFENDNENIEESSPSTKDLINKFEIQTEGPKVTINASYIGRTENFLASPIKVSKIETSIVENEKAVQKEDFKFECDLSETKTNLNENYITEPEPEPTNLSRNQINEQLEKTNHNILKLTWSCSYCTLENPNWRIICEVCEHLKPFDNKLKEIKKHDVGKMIKSLPTSSQNLQSSNQDWEWKAEIVKKYFQKQDNNITSTGFGGDSSNSSELRSILHKSPSSERLPINSPRLSRNQSHITENSNEKMNKNLFDSTKNNEKKNSNNQISKNDISSINLEQIRVARLAKFNVHPDLNKEISKNTTNLEEKSNFLSDPNSLEMEKRRLREKIRAMNAKALAEKYPIVKKNLSLDDSSNSDLNVTSQTENNNNKNIQRPVSSIENKLKKNNGIENFSKNKIKISQEPQKPLNSTDNILDVLQENSPKNIVQTNRITNNNNVSSNSTNSSSPSPKSGAIKKVFTKIQTTDKNLEATKLSNDSTTNPSIDEIYIQQNKPNKVSSSCQTSGLVKKSENNEWKSNNTLNALISPIKGHKFTSNLNKMNDDSTILYQKLSDFDKEQVKEISKKLTSIEGRNNFKMNLDENQGKGISRTDTLVLNKILRNLEQAICEGKHELAAKLAMDLAKMKVSLQVTKLKPKKSHSFDQDSEQSFIVDMFIEDHISQKGPIQISIKPSMTVHELKEKAYKDYNIPIQLQRWIINDELLYNDTLTLYECGVKNNLASLYLYLLTSATSGINDNINYKFTIPKTSKAFPEDDFSDKISIDSLDLIETKYQNGGANALKFNPNSNKRSLLVSDEKKSENYELESNTTSIDETAPWECPLCTLINNPMALSCSACSKTKPLTKDEKSSISEELRKFLRGDDLNSNIDSKQKLKFNNLGSIIKDSNEATAIITGNTTTTTTTTITITSSNSSNNNNKLNNNFNLNNKDNGSKILFRPIEKKNDLNKTSPNRKSTEIYNIIEEVIKPIPGNLSETKPNPIQEHQQRIVTVNFSSPNITKNKYRGVDNFNPYRKDTNDIFLQQNQPNESSQNQTTKSNSTKNTTQIHQEVSRSMIDKDSKCKQLLKPDKKLPMMKSPYSTNHYLELLKLDYSDVVQNFEQFECPICFGNIQPGNGIVLRDCLHSFCKECLADTIKFNEEAQVKCPYMDKEYSCNSFLQEREIRSLVTKDIYEKHLARSIKLAEHQIENAFHCKTANCRGWCIYEDNVNEFLCPVCNLKNCLTCGAIHDGITCKQYQDGLNDCDNNEDAKRTKEMFQEMVEKGEALNCPTCQVIMMKKWGCDWLKCSMCKTEVCWVTKGPRWGAGGKGDTSGGCKCGVNGVKCHPKCNYCH